jgi:hypothetical protein
MEVKFKEYPNGFPPEAVAGHIAIRTTPDGNLVVAIWLNPEADAAAELTKPQVNGLTLCAVPVHILEGCPGAFEEFQSFAIKILAKMVGVEEGNIAATRLKVINKEKLN